LGVCYIHNGNYRGAEEMFDIAVHLAPNYGYMIGQEYIKAGTGLLDEGKTEPATQLFNKAVKYQPNLKENKKIHQ